MWEYFPNYYPDKRKVVLDLTNRELLQEVCDIWGKKEVSIRLGVDHKTVGNWLNFKNGPRFDNVQVHILQGLLPSADIDAKKTFKFVDLFAGIGGLRKGFDSIGGECVFTSEWNKYSVQTYKANYYSDPKTHVFNEDIRDITKSNDDSVSELEAYDYISQNVPDHDVLLAGFPCQPFSLAGVSKKNALGRAHGFECQTQGTLFFDVARILASKRPSAFLLENVKNLKSHDKGKTFKVIMETLDELGYWVADSESVGTGDPKVIDAKSFLPQHRERIVLVGFRKDLNVHNGFTLADVSKFYPKEKVTFSDILSEEVDDKYILTPRLWEYLYEYAKKHKAKGNGFGYGLVNPLDKSSVSRTLSARYHKDGSEILIDRGWDRIVGEKNFWCTNNQLKRPRRLTPRECARLMGFDGVGKSDFKIPVSDTQAYRQFGNSVVVPVFEAVAKLMKERIVQCTQLSMDRSKVA